MALEHRISEDAAGQRLDKFVRKLLPGVPLSHVYKMVRTKKVRVNGKRAEISYLLRAGDTVTVRGSEEHLKGAAPPRPENAKRPPGSPRPEVARRDFGILHEDEHILVADKPEGLAVHTGTGIHGATLVDQVRAYLGGVWPEGEFKPSPAHRLDRGTSGIVVVAKTRRAMVRLTEMFTLGEADKHYFALAKGRFQKPRGLIDLPLAERQQTSASRAVRGVNMQKALTRWRVVSPGAEATLLECEIETGRTHQIRRHLEAIGHAVAGDDRYGDFPFNRRARADWGLKRLFLHSTRMAMKHPVTGAELSFSSPLPEELAAVLRRAGIAPPPA
jgi:23S rRNA pseudouridine955/2504/2580 synthase